LAKSWLLGYTGQIRRLKETLSSEKEEELDFIGTTLK